jgi:hypothetical protein
MDPRAAPAPGDWDAVHGTWSFTVQDAANLTGASMRSISFWSGPAHVVTPDIAGGHRNRKWFSARNLVQLRVVSVLTERWIALNSLRALMRTAEHCRARQGDWFELRLETDRSPAKPDQQVELLVCAGPQDWKLFRFPTLRLGRPLVGDVPLVAASELVRECEDHEELRVVNMGRIKRLIGSRLIRRR